MSGYTQEQVDALRAAIAKGANMVRFGDEMVQYRSLAEMRSILAEMEASLAGGASRQHYPKFVARPQ